MSSKVWVIRGYHFGYNDECFGKCGNYKVDSFETKEEAEQAYKRLEINDARQFPLKDMEFAMCTGDDELKELDNFVYEKCGQRILGEYGELIDDVLPHELSDDDTFAFINKAHAHAYQLVEFSNEEANETYWVAYFPYAEEYLSRDWINGVEMWEPPTVYNKNIAALKDNFAGYYNGGMSMRWAFDDFGCELLNTNDVVWLQLKGLLKNLTEQPLILEKVIAQYPNDLKYQQEILSISSENQAAFWAVNELLIQPVVEFQSYTLDELEDNFENITDRD